MINSQELDTDIFQIALADILPTPSERRQGKWNYDHIPKDLEILLEKNDGNFNKLMAQIRNGTIKKADIGDEALKMYEDTLRSDSLISRDQSVR